MQELTPVERLMNEVEVNVQRIIDSFRFLLKYRVMFRGSGLEFAGLREYSPAVDDARRIDWKASLRAKEVYVKMYEEERDLNVFILLDSSSTMLTGTQDKLKSEYAAVVTGCLAFAGIETGDNVGFAMFNDNVKTIIEPANDITNYYIILKELVDPKNYGGRCNLGKAIQYILEMVPERTILFIISDFIGTDPDWESSLKMASGKFDQVFGLQVLDERDSLLPKGIGYMRLLDPLSSRALTVDIDEVRGKYEKMAADNEEHVRQEFTDSRASIIKVYTTKAFVEPLVKYLELTEAMA